MIEEIVDKSQKEEKPIRNCSCYCYCPWTGHESLNNSQLDSTYEVGNSCGCSCPEWATENTRDIAHKKTPDKKTSEMVKELLKGIETQIVEKRDTEK